MKPLSVVLYCLVFAYSLLVAPLLVECVTPDGRALLEWIGQDPCRDDPFHSESTPMEGPGITAGSAGHAANPCSDFVLSNLDGTRNLLSGACSTSQGPIHPLEPIRFEDIRVMVPTGFSGEPVHSPPGCNPPFHCILRI
jgi:hypothetical protein